jgi:serine/threonine protein phosphatase PrpC
MIPAERAHLHVTAISHPGSVGKDNEDRYGISAHYVNDANRTPSLLVVVADGIGGHRAGEVAAELAVETVSSIVSDSDASDPVFTLQRAIILAGHAVSEKAESDLEYQGMGSTVACAWVLGSKLYLASVGDTRIYLVRNHTIRQLTTDHTWVQEAIQNGALKPEEARNHPNAHVIRRYLGSRQDVVPDIRLRLQPEESDARAVSNQGMHLQPGDLLFVCSDGLTDLVDDDEILSSLETRNAHAALEELVKLANQRGGHDNITIVTLRVPATEKPTIPVTVRRSRSRLTTAGLIAGTLLLAGVIFLGGLFWYSNRSNSGAEATPTLPPSQATLSIIIGPTLEAPTATPVPGLSPVASPSTTPLSATLTPWPTNTLSP